LVPVLGGLVLAAWLALLLWEQSPYGRYLDHGRWTDLGLAGAICRTLPGGAFVLPGLLYAGGWLLMTAAMMLPVAVPLLQRFERMVSSRADRASLLGLVVAGYLLAWLGFGLAAHTLDEALHATAQRSPWLALNGWVLGAIVLALAGLFQFSRLKRLCLEKCRTPLSFLIRHWHGTSPRRDAFALGLHHGLFCVGCCWALMLLMFVVGTGSVGWMLALGAVMAIEKNVRWGSVFSPALGFALLAGAGAIVAANFDPR
jgi:predicted metal-binding membrane protein